MSLICPCCNSNDVVYGTQKFGYKIMRCKRCTVEFVFPLPTKEELEKFYNNSNITTDIKDQIQKNIDAIENDKNSPQLLWYAKIINLAKHFCKKTKLDILELGSSYGSFLHFANLLGNNATGTESTRAYSEVTDGMINGKIIYVENDEFEKYFKQDSFDLIYLEHVFEHIDKPGVILDKLQILLRENGVIIIFVPNHNSLLAHLYGTKWSWVHPPSHLFHYNKKSLSSLLELHNYEVIKVWTGDYFRTMHHFYSFHSIENKIKSRLNKYFHVNLQFTSNPTPYKKKQHNPDLIPYWLMYPFLKVLSKAHLGNELIIVARKRLKSSINNVNK